MTAIPYGHCVLNTCIINDIPHEEIGGEANFVVREIKIFEDHCKPYFTAQLVIETYQHAHEYFVFPTAEVYLSFICPSSDPNFISKRYDERFRIFSHESTNPDGGQFVARTVHTLSLIGQEYYNDKHNNVMRFDKSVTGTAAAKRIHDKYIQRSDTGSLQVAVPSNGMIGSERNPHKSTNLKPFKAINDILDRCTWSGKNASCAPVYFRNKRGYVISPLRELLEARPLPILFEENQNQGHEHIQYLGTKKGYENILAIKPLSPSGEASSGVKASEISGMMKAVSYFDSTSGKFNNISNQIEKVLKGFDTGVPGLNQKIKPMMEEAYKGNRGGGFLEGVVDHIMQARAIDKNGPGGYAVKQEALVTALTYTEKYWVQVPGQSGHKVTCGDKIAVRFQQIRNGRATNTDKVLYVARLVHHIKFYENDERKRHGEHAKTEMYGVSWGY